MIYRFELNFGGFKSEVFMNIPGESTGNSEALRMIRAYVSEFKTYCIISDKPYNIPHFINWMNKYKIYNLYREIPLTGRVDL
jgi:hypothetical protein